MYNPFLSTPSFIPGSVGSIGVLINAGSTDNTIGGAAAADRNVISGNAVYGVYLSDSGTQYNVVENDFIGTDQSGSFAVPNGSLPQTGTVTPVAVGTCAIVFSATNAAPQTLTITVQ